MGAIKHEVIYSPDQPIGFGHCKVELGDWTGPIGQEASTDYTAINPAIYNLGDQLACNRYYSYFTDDSTDHDTTSLEYDQSTNCRETVSQLHDPLYEQPRWNSIDHDTENFQHQQTIECNSCGHDLESSDSWYEPIYVPTTLNQSAPSFRDAQLACITWPNDMDKQSTPRHQSSIMRPDQRVVEQALNNNVNRQNYASSSLGRADMMRTRSGQGLHKVDHNDPITVAASAALANFHHRGSLQLWQFLVALLDDSKSQHLICWTGTTLEFKLNEPEEVARLWGIQKNRPAMNYDKLSRSLRYYYEKGIIQKVSGERYVYRFVYEPDLLFSLAFPCEDAHLNTETHSGSARLHTEPTDGKVGEKMLTSGQSIDTRIASNHPTSHHFPTPTQLEQISDPAINDHSGHNYFGGERQRFRTVTDFRENSMPPSDDLTYRMSLRSTNKMEAVDASDSTDPLDSCEQTETRRQLLLSTNSEQLDSQIVLDDSWSNLLSSTTDQLDSRESTFSELLSIDQSDDLNDEGERVASAITESGLTTPPSLYWDDRECCATTEWTSSSFLAQLDAGLS